MMTVEWSEPAEIDYWKNIQYLENEWTLKEVHNFMDKTDELIDLLEKGNVTFKPTDYKDTFQVPVVKQITLYYRVTDNKVELLRFWNNYQDLANFSL
jgi:plasmid stabilization system protein ParE